MSFVWLSSMDNRYIHFYPETLTISSNGMVGMFEGRDINCYNYTLRAPFKCTPNIAIGNLYDIQPLVIYKINIVLTCFSPLSHTPLKTLEWFPLLLERIGDIPDGLRLLFPSLLKHRNWFKPDIIKSIQVLYQLAYQERPYRPTSHIPTITVI